MIQNNDKKELNIKIENLQEKENVYKTNINRLQEKNVKFESEIDIRNVTISSSK